MRVPVFAPPSPAAAPAPPASSVSAADAARLDRVIKKVGENTWELERGFVDGVFNQSEPLGRCTRLYEQSGGYRIMCVEPGNLFDRMGLQNEDILLQINDQGLDNTISLFFGMSGLRAAPQLVTRIRRGGTERVHTYNVR